MHQLEAKVSNVGEQANLFGALLGAFVIVALLVLAWIISVRVLREINRTNRLKDEFLATISHEMRTPMNGIIGSLNLLSKVELSPDQQVWLEAASRSADTMLMSIDDILELSEIMSGRGEVQLASLCLRPFIEKLVAVAQVDVESKGLTTWMRWWIVPWSVMRKKPFTLSGTCLATPSSFLHKARY